MTPPPRTWLGKFADAFRGFFLSITTQSSFAAHLPVAAAAVAAGFWLGLSLTEWGLVVLAIGLVVMAEVFNTSLEALAKAVLALITASFAVGQAMMTVSRTPKSVT